MKPFQLATPVGPEASLVGTDVILKNDKYQVAVYALPSPHPGWPDMVHLSIKRIDREPIHDWRDLQLIKNMVVGPEHEAVELYPAESRLIDTANQYHLYAIAVAGEEFPFGYHGRLVSDCGETPNAPNAKQRKWAPDERPPDCKSADEIEEMVKKYKGV